MDVMSTTLDDELPESLRERKKLQTRRAIHLAALQLVDEQGLEHATIDQICRDADVSTRTFFNYYPSKTAAALDLPETAITEEAAERFRAADGLLVAALCDAIAGMADLGAERVRMKELITRRPELMPALTQWMSGVRGQVVALAEERAASHEEAVLAVTLVMAALGTIVHDPETSDAPVADRLRAAVERLERIHTARLR
jgi:AcrR family transcriptional regulator